MCTLRSALALTAILATALAGGAVAADKAPGIEKVAIGPGGGITVNGQPFFPLANFWQSVDSMANAETMGLNAYFMPGDRPPPKEYLDALAERGLYGFVPFAEEAVGHPALLGWVQPHEPDKAYLVKEDAEMSPEKMLTAYEAMKKTDPTRLVVLDVSPEFMSDPALAEALTDKQKRDVYPRYARAADVLTFNVYPVWGHNRPDRIDWVADAARDLRRLVGSEKPVMAMIETTTGWREIDPADQKPLTVEAIRSEVWMAVIGGAKGIIYFTHRFKPSFSEHALDAERHAAIREINEQLTRLAPAAVCSPDAETQPTIAISGGLAAQCLAKQTDDGVVIFAQNIDMQRRGGLGTITVPGLAVGTLVEVVDENRTITAQAGRFTDRFAPLAVHIYRVTEKRENGKLEPIESVAIGERRELRVNGKPFLPIMVWLQSERQIPNIRAAAMNTICAQSTKLSPTQYLDRLAGAGLYGIMTVGTDAEVAAHPHMLGWIQGDEPDMPKKQGERFVPRHDERSIAEPYAKAIKIGPRKPVFMNFTIHFLPRRSKFNGVTIDSVYPKFVRHCDVVGFDTYPIYGSSMPGRLWDVPDGVAVLQEIAGADKPVYAWIETSKGSKWMTYEKQLDVLPMHTRAEVWMALIRGASGIGYFTHAWKPSYTQFRPKGQMVSELRRLNKQITRLAPALLASPAPHRVAVSPDIKTRSLIKATVHDGYLWLFAQNIDLGPDPDKLKQFQQISPRPTRASILVGGLRSGTTIEVVDEDRTITSETGRFFDTFEPLREHIYRIKM